MSSSPTTAEVVAGFVAATGRRHLFGYPGDPTIELMEQLRRLGVEVVLGRREGSAGFMAEGYAMATGEPAFVVSTLGPGSTALVNPVAAATLDRVPIVAISGQIEAAREQFFTHQVVDHKLLYTGVTKWAGRLERGAVATTMRKALRLACAERPGAVHLTCTSDTFLAPAGDDEVRLPPLRPSLPVTTVSSAPGGEDPLRMLAASRRPVLLAGIGAARAGAGPALVRLAEGIGAPIVVAPMAKGVVPEDHDLFAGVLDMACNKLVWDFVGGSDLLVAAGFDGVELIKPWHLRTPVLHVDALANVDQIYASDCEVLGDISASLDWLASGWSGEPRWQVGEVAAFRRRLLAAYYSGRVEGRLNPTDVVDSVAAHAPPGTLVTADVGSHKLLVGQGWRAFEPRSVLMSNGLSSMGFGLPAAIGASLARPGRPVVALVGDGGFAMAATELRLAASLGLPVVVVVFVDGSLNRIELKQMAQGYPSTATRIEELDLAQLAAAMSCRSARASTPKELESALEALRFDEGPALLEARIDPSQYESQF